MVGMSAKMEEQSANKLNCSLHLSIIFKGGCELCSIQRRSVIMANNSDKVYKFTWDEVEYIVIKPSMGYISPGEEKDLEVMFLAGQPVSIKKVMMVGGTRYQ